MSEKFTVCAGCLQPIKGRQLLCCSICKQHYDLLCANVSEQRYHNTLTGHHRDAWKCALCLSKMPRSDNTNTPVRSVNEGVTVRRGAAVTSPEEDNRHMNTTTLDTTVDSAGYEALVLELRLFREEMAALRAQMHMLSSTMCALSSRMDECDGRVSKLDERITIIEKRLDSGNNESLLHSTIERLKTELNERDQESLLSDIEISCIPEVKGENLVHIVTALATKLGVNLTEQDVVCATRVGPLAGSSGGPSSARPRLIVVRMTRRAIRDQMLKAARVRRGATTEGLGLPGTPQRFFVNERLTRTNRQIFRRARDVAGRLNWRFVWTRDGRVYTRQHHGADAPRHRLRTEEDLERVFGTAAVREPSVVDN